MIKTILVDDDFLVRSYLKQLTAWEQEGYSIIADVRDGEEALHQIESEMPDVVVTDLSMPLMDGIELIRTIRERNYPVYIVVLSCHDDFQYVKEAMRLGADEYVLKNSLDENSLHEILHKISGQMGEHRERHRQEVEAKRLEQAGRDALKYHFFNSLLAGELSSKQLEDRRREAGITALYQNSAVVNMFLPDWNALKLQYSTLELEQYCQRFQQRLLEILQNIGREQRTGDPEQYVEGVYLGEGIFCCFVDLSHLRRSSQMMQRLTTIATACFRCCKTEAYRFIVGVSGICFGTDGIRQAYQQAREMVKLGFYEKDMILYYEESPAIGKKLPEEAERLLETVKELQNREADEEFGAAYHAVMLAFRAQHTESRLVLHWLKALDHKLGIERNSDSYHELVSIQQVESWGEAYRQFLGLNRCTSLPDGISPGVRLAVKYLQEHYREQTGLSETAQEVGLNATYLSYLFKQEMGTGFRAYLLELRMEHARKLLETTNDKIKDVAACSGFQDYHYFTKTFKKIYGISPADYRRQESKNKTQNL